ncbi:MAG: hypothetical protein U5K36_15550 [Roseovarius sp.]|nr:hypothetical protein [Roseovarius sp.]
MIAGATRGPDVAGAMLRSEVASGTSATRKAVMTGINAVATGGVVAGTGVAPACAAIEAAGRGPVCGSDTAIGDVRGATATGAAADNRGCVGATGASSIMSADPGPAPDTTEKRGVEALICAEPGL